MRDAPPSSATPFTPAQQKAFAREVQQRAHDGVAEAVVDGLRSVRDDIAASADPSSLAGRLAHNLDRRDLLERVIAEAMPRGDAAHLVRGLYVTKRMTFLAGRLREPIAYSGCDCLHVFDMLDALAGRDVALFRRYLDTNPPAASRGHRDTVLLCNAVTALGRQDEARFAALAGRLAPRPQDVGKTTYKAGLYRALLGVAAGDPVAISAGLAAMVPLHARRGYPVLGTIRFVALEAHGVYNLARLVLPAAVSARIETPTAIPWWQALADADGPRDDAPLLLDLPPALDGLRALVRELPTRVTPEDFARPATLRP